MYDKLDENFKKIVDQKRKEFSELETNPPFILQNVWYAFWELRNTKSLEHPINHTDIRSYKELMNYQINKWEVRQILEWDATYYKCYKQHKEN